MLKKSLMIAVSSAALLYAGSASAFLQYDVEDIQKQAFAGESFSANLAREYKAFATFEAYQMYDWIDAEHFAEKAIMAYSGKEVMPENISDWSIKDKYVAELTTARASLMDAMAKGARTAAPGPASTAQAKYDCWIEQQEENHQWDHIAACKAEFYAAMDALNTAMAPKVVSMTKTTVNVPQQLVATMYFGFDSASLVASEEAKIEKFVSTIEDKKAIELIVVGHADRSGPADYNQALSQKRAEAVVSALRDRGMMVADVKEVDVLARGETDPAVSTGDGVREPRNRRVNVFARAVQPVTSIQTSQSNQ